MVGDYFPYVFVKLCFGAFPCANSILQVITVILFLLPVAYYVKTDKKMVIIVIAPKPDRATDVVSVLSSAEWSACLEIGISHIKSFLK